MGRRIVASLLIVLAACLTVLPLAQGQGMVAGQSAPSWTTVLSENMEGDFPGSTWTLYGDPTWGKTNYRAHGGSFGAYCASSNSIPVSPPGLYPNNMDGWMVYGPFDLSQATDAEVQFYHWTKTEAIHDYLILFASADGENWAGPGWSGDCTIACSGWCQETFSLTNVGDLGNLCGAPEVWIAFGFHSNASTQDEGSYLDDITLRALVGGAQPSATPTPTATATTQPSRTPTPTHTEPPGGYKVYLPILQRGASQRVRTN